MTTEIVELNCVEYRVTSASMAHGHAGGVFCCTISSVTDEVLETLEAAARSSGMIRLGFLKRPLLLERVDVQRVEAGAVRLSGQVSTS